ncbi:MULTISPECIES: Hsp20/alpha crystallin family protein [Natrialba]|uniref:Heat shock protein Hsp20 n=1 Tax=Natrialba aegyptia DSM 13077 TaxID=1227491 RepID=M0B095_9EURY|nr:MULTISPECIES: Hsp20/alpha crystallin family protein [Natrialba]ELZ03633.1 heat shock protein Hsp20 [Natrialba aegyptia DSM 13077]
MADRPSPFDGIDELLDRLNRQLETAARSWESGMEDRSRFDLSMGSSATSLDMTDEGDAFVVTVDVPGYETDDLDIRLSGKTLSIQGERKRATEDEESDEGDEGGDVYIRREREVQSFSRQVSVPEPVDAENADATVNNGILTVELPKRDPDSESHQIDIQ